VARSRMPAANCDARHRLSVTFDSNIGSFGSFGPVGLHLHLLFHVFELSKVVARDA
jgi:hypothetical protein